MSHPDFSLPRRRLLAMLAAAPAALALGRPAFAQAWPARPVTMVVPFGPGASNDIFTRQLSAILGRDLGQPFVVENKPGAGGYTGALTVVQAPPDGYRFLETPSSITGLKPILGADLDPLRDLTPVAQMATAPGIMVVPASLGVNTVQEFIDFTKGRSENTFVGITGVGGGQHQMAERFKAITGLNLTNVNHQSSAETTAALVSGRLQVQFATVASVAGQLEAGTLKILAYNNDSYAPGSPAAPTMAEAGVQGMETSQTWWGILGPRGLPDEITMAMNAAINAALDDPAFVDVLHKNGVVAVKGSPDDFAATIENEMKIVEEFVTMTGIKPK